MIEDKRSNILVKILHYVNKALGIAIVLSMVSLAYLFFYKPDITNNYLERISGFIGLDDYIISINGTNYIQKEDVRLILKKYQMSNIYDVNITKLRKELINSSLWIEDVTIVRYFPNKIVLTIEEKVPLAIWQESDADPEYFLDNNAEIIDEVHEEAQSFFSNQHFILIKGKESKENFLFLFQIFSKQPSLFNRINELIFIDKRRWDVIISDVRIKLPLGDIEQVWNKFHLLDKRNNLFDANIKVLDFRIENKVFIEVREKTIEDLILE